MMYFRHLSTAPKGHRKTVPWILAVCTALLLLRVLPIPDGLLGSVHSIGAPFFKVRDAAVFAIQGAYQTLQGNAALVRENNRLRAEITTLGREHHYVQQLMQDRDDLRELIGRSVVAQGGIPAVILQSEQYAPFDTFVLSVGAKDGVREGMLVTMPDGVVLGETSRVLEQTSVARALTAPGASHDALMLGESDVPLRIEGSGAGTMVGQLPRDTPVAEGALIVLPNETHSPIGTVARVVSGREDAYQQLYIAPLANTRHERYVVVDTVSVWRSVEAFVHASSTSNEEESM